MVWIGSLTKNLQRMTSTLIGKWKLVREGSDFLPGLDTVSDAPLILKLLGNNDVEFFKIDKKKFGDVEEIHFTYTTKHMSLSRGYQLGTCNCENFAGKEVSLATVVNCSDDFTEFAVIRLGPKTGQNSREAYELDVAKDVVKLNIEMVTAEGTSIKMIKFLSRFDQSVTENPPFALAARSNGWRRFEFWPSTALSNVQVRIVRAVKIKSMNIATKETTRVLENVWQSSEIDPNAMEVEWSTIPRVFAGKSTEGEEFVTFVVQVGTEGGSWLVAKRYMEFDALRHFLIMQNPHNTDLQQINSKFPGKAVLFRKSVLDARLRGLESFLVFCMEQARYCRQNALDALCSFLQLPEHMYLLHGGPALVNRSTAPPAALPTPPPAAPVSVPAATAPAQAAARTTATAAKPAAQPQAAAAKPAAAAPKPTPSKPAAAAATTSSSAPSAATTSSSPPPAPLQSTPAAPVQQRQEPERAPLGAGGMTAAQQQLLSVLEDGMMVVKHGRQGAPKSRLLRCNRDVTELFFQADDHRKVLKLNEVTCVRLGTEIDPTQTSTEAIRSLQDNVSETSARGGGRPGLARRASLAIRGKSDLHIYFGTPVLRRTCKPEDMRFCVSLLTPDRSFDVQCRSMEEVRALHGALLAVCPQAAAPATPTALVATA